MSLNDRHTTQLWKMKVESSDSGISYWIGSSPYLHCCSCHWQFRTSWLSQHVIVNYLTSNDWNITSAHQVRRKSGFSIRPHLSHLSLETFIWLPAGQTVQPPDPNMRSNSYLWPLGMKSKPFTSSQHQLLPQITRVDQAECFSKPCSTCSLTVIKIETVKYKYNEEL